MIEKIIGGFQSGADIAGIRAAHALSIPTAGMMPLGFRTECGSMPEYADFYGATEHGSPSYQPRTFHNAANSDVTLWFGRINTPGYFCTIKGCRKARKPFWEIGSRGQHQPPQKTAVRINLFHYRTVNIAGGRESTNPGIEQWVQEYVSAMIQYANAAVPPTDEH